MYWTGRHDGDEMDVLRIHQVIQKMTLEELMQQKEEEKKICFVSFNSEEGIRRNFGRLGASEGWIHLKKAFANFPIFDPDIHFYDLKHPIEVIDGNLEAAQEELSEVVAQLKSKNFLVVCLGGGHDIAYGTYNGILKYAQKKEEQADPKIGIISFDAHFDMRSYENGASSGSMFLQIADDSVREKRSFDYNVIGIQKFSNTKRLFDTAKKFGVNYYLAEDIKKLNEFNIDPIIKRNDYIHLTLCTDVFHITSAPGVSAPQSFGIMPHEAMRLLNIISTHTGDLTIDVAEISPKYDFDDRTSRLMANLIYQTILNHFGIDFK